MKNKLYILGLALLLLVSCHTKKDEVEELKNEVIVLGTIHGQHLTQSQYSIEVLTAMIRKIAPDIILTEIPPDRYSIAMQEFLQTGKITEARVVRFPEYVDVIFPLYKDMGFEIIPTAGWTKEMSDQRNKQLKAISEDPARASEWQQLQQAEKKSSALIKATGREFDPYWINSDAYDQLAEIELSVYNNLFNDELGAGGWDNINAAHYALISQALDEYKFQGKRILITYGAGHKGWFLRKLKQRNDIELKTIDGLGL